MPPSTLIGQSISAGDISSEQRAVRFALCALAAVALVRFLTLGAYPLFDNTEARYAYIGKLIYETGNWVTPMVAPGVPFWAKPPLSMWAIAVSYSIFDVSEFSARLPFFLMVAGMAWLVFVMADNLIGRLGGVISALVFASSGLSMYLAGGVMTDPALIFGTTLIMVSFSLRMRGKHWAWGYLFFAGLVIALLAKGPIGAVLPGMAIGGWVLWHNKWREIWQKIPWVTGTLLTIAIALPWYVLAEMRTPGFLDYFIVGEHFQRFLDKNWRGDMYGAPRTHPLGTIWLFELIATLPWSPLLILIALKRNWRATAYAADVWRSEWVRYLALWILVPVLFFSATHAVLITYVGMGIPAFAIATGYVFSRLGWLERPFVASVAMIVPASLLAAVLLYASNPSTAALQTQLHTLQAFRAEHDANKGLLTYYRFAPHSTRFYGEKEFAEAPDLTSLIAKLDRGEKYFAMHVTRYAQLPEDVKPRFEIIALHNATYLLRSKSARPD